MEIRDDEGRILERDWGYFDIGTSWCKITDFSVDPKTFRPGENLSVSLTASNISSVSISVRVSIKIKEDEKYVAEIEDLFENLAPGANRTFKVTWDSKNANSSKNYVIQGMVFYDGSSTPQVTAVITPLSQFYLSTSSNVGETTGSGWYDPGSEAEIRATPPAAADGERYAWAGWSGAGGGSYTGDDNPVRVIVNDDINETASWRRQFYLKVVSEHGSPEGEDWYDAGSTATISIEVQVPQSGIGGLMGANTSSPDGAEIGHRLRRRLP